jgi:sialate O-acetylesterase
MQVLASTQQRIGGPHSLKVVFVLKFLGLFLGAATLCAALPTSAQPPAPASSAAASQPFLHPLFSDNAVLQRDRVFVVWGWTQPGAEVSATFAGRTFATKALANGRWTARFGPFKAGGPHELVVTGGLPAQTVRRTNILMGDVWLCSGQSNMEQGVGVSKDAQAEIAAANFPQIRLLTVPKATAATPQTALNSQWLVCSPTTIAQGGWGGFSAVGYYFGRKLHQELKVPIGLINSSWGGTIAEAWVSGPALNRDVPEFKGQVDTLASPQSQAPIEQRMARWWQENDEGTRNNFQSPGTSDAAWKTASLPGTWENSGEAGMQQFDGVVWYRREITVPAGMAGRDLSLKLGAIDDRDTTFWNGQEIGSTALHTATRAYKIPAAQVKAGRALIAIRVLDTGGGGGFAGPAEAMSLEADAQNALPLAGEWKMWRGTEMTKLAAPPVTIGNGNPNYPSVLYNGMIAPLVPYGLRGAIWYQGESNAGRHEQYKRLLPALINDWRARFNQPVPFYIVQLAGFMAPDEQPKDDPWPRIREAQEIVSRTVPNSGLAIATDIGEEADIHPKNKQDVGLRLALNALAKEYGVKVAHQGPVFKSARRTGTGMLITFDNPAGGLELRGKADRVFAVAGADKKFYWATPRVEGDKILAFSPQVPAPVAVRFGWSNLPQGHLYNKANLPAPPFRSDDW